MLWNLLSKIRLLISVVATAWNFVCPLPWLPMDFQDVNFRGRKTFVYCHVSLHDAAGTDSYGTAVFMVSEIRLGRRLSPLDCTVLLCIQGFLVLSDDELYQWNTKRS